MPIRSAANASILENPTSLFFAAPLCVLILAIIFVVRHIGKRRGLREQEVHPISAHTGRLGILDEGGTRARRRECLALYAYLSIIALLCTMLPLFDLRIHSAYGSRFGAKGEAGLRAILGFLRAFLAFLLNDLSD